MPKRLGGRLVRRHLLTVIISGAGQETQGIIDLETQGLIVLRKLEYMSTEADVEMN